MKKTPGHEKKASKIVFILGLLVSVYWVFGLLTNVYTYPVTGAIFEILWLPVIALTIVLPVWCIVFLIKERFHIKSFYLYTIVIMGLAILVISLYQN